MFDVSEVRSHFPALQRTVAGQPVVWADAPGGTQLPAEVISAMSARQHQGLSNLHGAFCASAEMDALVWQARERAAWLLGAHDPASIHFGANTTSLSFQTSHAVAKRWQPGQAIVVSQLDHDANVRPWVLRAEERGLAVRWWPLRSDGRLHLEDLASLLDDQVVLVAVTAASNSLGTLVDVAAVVAAAHRVGALTAVDAVHRTPHHLIDVTAWGCDIVTCSAYKFFGPHLGLQYLAPRVAAVLEPDRVAPAPHYGAARWETGTVNLSALAGLVATVDYLKGLGQGSGRAGICSAFVDIESHEAALSRHFLMRIADCGGVTVHGPGLDAIDQRTPTFGCSLASHATDAVAAELGARGVFTWSGHFYAINVPQALGLDSLLRIGFAHYHHTDEVDRVVDTLAAVLTIPAR